MVARVVVELLVALVALVTHLLLLLLGGIMSPLLLVKEITEALVL